MNTDYTILLDKSTPFDEGKIRVLDELLHLFYTNPMSLNIAQANQILVTLKEDPEFWLNADMILEKAQGNNTKFFALQVLEEAVKIRWKILPEEQRNAIKNYIVTMVIKMGSNLQNKDQHYVLSKVNSLLVEIVKQEWNTTWRNFIPDICTASKQDQNICENNLNLLKMLSEEIFDYSKNTMTSAQIAELKETMHKEFESIYELCYFIMKSYIENPSQVRFSLIEACIRTLHAFLSWIPLGYIFLTDLIDVILALFEFKELKPMALKCLIEIVILSVDGCSEEEGKKIKEQIFKLYSGFIYKLSAFIPAELSLQQERMKLEKQKSHNLTAFDQFCQQLALFFSGFLKTHLPWIEPLANNTANPDQMAVIELIKKGFAYLVQLSYLPDVTFKICVDYWYEFTNYLLKNPNKGSNGFGMGNNEPLLLLSTNNDNMSLQTNVYNLALVQVRSIMISRMAKPVEVLLVIDETGRPVRQVLQNTENNSLYEVMKELMINLTKLDWENTKSIMINKLEKQLDGTEYSFDNLNSLSWAIGSISGTVPQNEEKNFLIITIRNLLTLCEQRKGKENKAVIASDIMYVVGQYPRFLKSNWNFLKTVVKKLFEFMHESYPGVMEMAVNTFLKISETCKEEFVISHTKEDSHHHHHHHHQESEPYIDELIRKIPDETNQLEPEHKLVFYEAVGHMISCEKDFDRKNYLLQGVLGVYWEAWENMLREIEMNIEVLKNEAYIEQFVYIIRVHERLAYSVGHDFYKALAKIYMDLLKLYTLYSQLINSEIEAQGAYVINYAQTKRIRALKREMLGLIETFIEKSNDNALIAQNFIPPLSDVLQDYASSIPDAREAEVLSLFTAIVEKLTGDLTDTIPKILDLIFGATLQMITTDFNSYHDHRVNLFKFLNSIANHCFQALFNIPPEQFKTVIDCVLWAIKHELPAIFEVGLNALETILNNLNKDQNIANQFYQVYFMNLLQDILFVLTDSFHKSGFKQQASILSILFQVLVSNYITVPLDKDQGNLSNQEYIYNFLVNLFSSNFATLSKQQISQYLQRLFETCGNLHDFKVILRDYLIKMTQFDPEALEEKGQMNQNINGNM